MRLQGAQKQEREGLMARAEKDRRRRNGFKLKDEGETPRGRWCPSAAQSCGCPILEVPVAMDGPWAA